MHNINSAAARVSAGIPKWPPTLPKFSDMGICCSPDLLRRLERSLRLTRQNS